MALSPALAKKIADAKSSKGGNRIKDGNYIFAVERLEFAEKNGGNTFVAELRVIESESNGSRNIGDGTTGDLNEPNVKGSSVSFVCVLESTPSAAGNMKEMLCALVNADPDSGEAFLNAFNTYVEHKDTDGKKINTSQPARGMIIGAETYRKMTKNGKNAGKWGTYPGWAHIEQTAEEIKTRRAELDAPKQ